MKQHTHTRTRSHRQRTHRGASGIGSSLACGGIKYDMRLAGTVRLPQSRGVLRRLQSRSAWHCLVPVQHRPTEYWSASPPPPPPLRPFGVVPASAPLPLGTLPPHGIGGSGWYRVRQYLAQLSLAVGHRCLPCPTSSDVSALPADSWAPARRRRPAQLGPGQCRAQVVAAVPCTHRPPSLAAAGASYPPSLRADAVGAGAAMGEGCRRAGGQLLVQRQALVQAFGAYCRDHSGRTMGNTVAAPTVATSIEPCATVHRETA